jgi:adenine-specific DNA-methyltransferase
VGPDYVFRSPPPSPEDLQRVNPFDWRSAFGELGESPSFNAIIGNPPYIKEYVNHQPFHDLQGTELAKYYQGKMDIWYIFASLAIDLLKPKGLHSFIATNNWITNAGARNLRAKILSETTIHEFIDFGDFRVFQKAGIQTMIYLLQKRHAAPQPKTLYRRITTPTISEDQLIAFLFHGADDSFAKTFAAQVAVSDTGTISFEDDTEAALLQKIAHAGKARLNTDEIAQGIVAPQESVLRSHLPDLSHPSVEYGDGIFVISQQELQRLKLGTHELGIIKPFFTTTELDRYYGSARNSFWIVYTDKTAVKNIDAYPKIKAHLQRFSKIMTSDNKPFGLHRARNEAFFLGEKIIALRKTARPHFTYTDFPCYVSQTFNVIKPDKINPKYLTALLNSRLAHYWFDRRGKKQGDALQIDRDPLTSFPIRELDTASAQDATVLNQIITLVDQAIALRQQLHAARSAPGHELLASQVDLIEDRIDQRLFALYGLEPDDVSLIRNATLPPATIAQ